MSGLRAPRAAQLQGWGPGCRSPLPASGGQRWPLGTGAGVSAPPTLLFQSPRWPADPWAARADGRHSRVAAPARAARAGHHAAGPEAHVQHVQDHVVLHVEEEPAGRHPVPSLLGPGRRGRRHGSGGRGRRRQRLRPRHLRHHLGRPFAEQRGRGWQAGEKEIPGVDQAVRDKRRERSRTHGVSRSRPSGWRPRTSCP